MSICQYPERCPVCHKGFVNITHRPPLSGPGVELTIRKRAGAALSKTIIRILNDPALPENRAKVKTTGRNILATFQNNRFTTQLNGTQSREHTRRPTTDDHDPPGRRGHLGITGFVIRLRGKTHANTHLDS